MNEIVEFMQSREVRALANASTIFTWVFIYIAWAVLIWRGYRIKIVKMEGNNEH